MSAERDYVAEMDARIAAATGESGWAAPVVAAKMHAALLETDPDLLNGWLHAMAVDVLRMAVGSRSRAQRTVARRRAASRIFGAAAAEAEETGNTIPLLGLFAVVHVIDADNTRKLAADMTGPEHLFVAENTYQQSANQALMLAAFHRAVAKKVGERKTSDVFSAQQYELLYLSITRKAA